MSLLKEQRILSTLKSNPHYHAIRIITPSENFRNNFEVISQFFRQLKNGLNSVGGVSNREYFKNLSGCYFLLEELGKFTIILLYDASTKPLNELQVKTRIHKLMGRDIHIEFGTFKDYEQELKRMLGIVRKTQTFGDFYFQNQ